MKRDDPKIESLASLDEVGGRKTIIPLDVKGVWHKRKVVIQWILLAIFLIVPWLNIRGNPIILLNIGDRKFSFFGHLFFAHDAPLLFFIFAFLVLSLVVVTSIWGRVWCGYACPQTVFIERIYRKIEDLIEGNPIQRRKDLGQPLNSTLALKRTIKWILFFIVSSLFAHSFTAYFVGAESVLEMVKHSPNENWGVFLVTTFITLLLLFDFGWFREQFCIIMCPYGRFQSVLMDENSMSVIYDEERGEPRKGLKSDKPQGDCISCRRCIEVCPTGIDIRQGVQLECIACTACIDACDEIMEKVNKPKGLIRYDNAAREPLRLFKPRNLIYFALIGIITSAFIYSIMARKDLHFTLMRVKDAPYQFLNEKELLNHFKLHLKNQSNQTKTFLIQASSDKFELITQINPITLIPHSDKQIHFFIKFPKSLLSDQQLTPAVLLKDSSTKEVMYSKGLELLGPNQ